MRVALVASIAAAIAVSVGAGVAGATPTRSACTLSSKTVKGHKAAIYCGSATASLHIGGTSYSFKSGTCIWEGGTLILDVGTQVNGAANNAGEPLFALTSATGLASVYAFSGRFHLGMSSVKIAAHAHSSGTFKGREPLGATRRFTGAYRC
jgi:hypothetical protein